MLTPQILDFDTIKKLPFRVASNITILPDDTASSASISWAKHQISKCCTNHACFPELTSSRLPTRVLDISGQSKDVVKLVITSREIASYICLSHCWGDQNSMVRTTKNTVKEHIKGIQISKLPVTFRDAVDISRRLGIKYLWIDSLCIIQDSKEDWHIESTQMADIYENSYVTIAATASNNGQGGCYRTTSEMEKDQEIELESDVYEPARLYLRKPLRHFDLHVDIHRNKQGSDFPLLERAWVLQERLLSPRTLHFCNREIVFECRETMQCQCGEADIQANVKADFIRMLHSGPTIGPTNAHIGWWTVVQRYTRLGLSFDKDRLIALSGVARRMMGQQENDYMAGIWKSSFPEGLLWRVDYPDDCLGINLSFPRRLSTPRAPSWSWASLEAAVTWHFPQHLMKRTANIEIQEVNCFSVGNDIYGQIKGGILRISGLVTHGLLRWQRRSPSRYSNSSSVHEGYNSIGIDTEWDFQGFLVLSEIGATQGGQFYPDYDFHLRKQSPLEIVLLWITPTRLLVLRSLEQIQKYERIGLLDSHHNLSYDELKCLSKIKYTTLEIV